MPEMAATSPYSSLCCLLCAMGSKCQMGALPLLGY